MVERIAAPVLRNGDQAEVRITSAGPLLGAFQATTTLDGNAIVLAEWLHIMPPDPAVTPQNTRFSANCYL
ncbi:MAG: hypothetical protein N3A66_04810, partial [Planctomycetota bacterium]|nr:hypothetical protein [Planctomycetota bacterium]